MAGYSGTPLPRKLGFKPGHRAALVGAPPGYPAALGELPEDVRFEADGARELDLVLLFAREASALDRAFPPAAARLQPAGMLWIAWPKKASRQPTDLTEDVVRTIGLAAGLVDVKVCAIDETWSGLKFVRRVSDR